MEGLKYLKKLLDIITNQQEFFYRRKQQLEEVPFYKKEKNYQTVERALKILEIIRTFSDEENTITQRKIMDEMMDKGESVNERTISSTIRKLLEALNKESNNDRDTHKYRILYNGCDNKNRKMQHISGLRYVHDFSFEELDTIHNKYKVILQKLLINHQQHPLIIQ